MACLLTVLASFVFAQPSSDIRQFGDARYGTTLTGFRDGDKVSFTKVEFGIVPETVAFGPDIVAVWYTDSQVTIGPWLVLNDPLPHGGEFPGPLCRYRFDSTYFADGSNIPITFSANFHFRHANGLEESTPYSTTYNLVSYNKMALIGSGKNQNQQPDAAFLDDSTRTLQASADRKNGHSLLPATVQAAVSIGYLPALQNIKASTVVNISTHGSRDSISTDDAPIVNFPFIKTYCDAKAAEGIPPVSLAVVYACQTLLAPYPYPCVEAFGITDANRAYVGFDEAVSIFAYSKKAWNTGDLFNIDRRLNDHALVFWRLLAGGYTIGDACNYEFREDGDVQIVRGIYPARIVGLEIKMQGDFYTRYSMVYLDPNERYILTLANKPLDVYWVPLPVSGGN